MDHSEGKRLGATPETGPGSLGPYAVIAPIATGEATLVQLAQKHGALGFHRMAAVKQLKPALASQQAWKQLLLDEARLRAAVHHANVVDVLDVGDDGSYLVMEYIEGADLDTLLRCAGRERHARYVLPPIVDALQGLHALHIAKDALGESLALVHQAPRGRHILVGIDGTARITDLSQVAARGLAPSQLRRERLKPGYTAPEQLDAPASVDPRSDVFVVGITLWEALTGERLFASDDAEQSAQAVRDRHIPRPSEVGLRPPRCFDPIVLRALARDPSQRFQSAGDMARELREVASNQALYATSGELGQWVRALSARVLLERRHALGADAPSIEMPLDALEAGTSGPLPSSQVRPARAIAITGDAGPTGSVAVSGTVPLRNGQGTPPSASASAPIPSEPSRVARAPTVPVAAPPARVPPASYASPAMTLLGVSPRPGELPEPSRRAPAASTYQVAPDRRAGATVPERGAGLELGPNDWPGWTPHAGSPAVSPAQAEPLLRGGGFVEAPLPSGRGDRRVRVIHFDEPSDPGLRGPGARGAHLHQTDWGDEAVPSGGKSLGVLSVVLVGIIVVAGVVGFRQWSAEDDAPLPSEAKAAGATEAPGAVPELAPRTEPAGDPTVTATAPVAPTEPASAQPEQTPPAEPAEKPADKPTSLGATGLPKATGGVGSAASVGGAAPRPSVGSAPASRPVAAPESAPKRPAGAAAPANAPERVWIPKSAVKPSAGASVPVPPPRPMPSEPGETTPSLPRNPYE